jgi:predicted membrane protein
VPAVFATFLLLSLALAGALAFSAPKTRRWLKWVLLLSLALAWVALAFAVKDIVLRTSATLVTPGGARQPHLVDQAAREGVRLFASLGGPALLATLLGWLAVRATRPHPE